MRRIGTIAPLLFAVALGVPREAQANRLDSTTWTMAGSEKVKITGQKAKTTVLPATALTVDAASRMVLANSIFTLAGAYSDKPGRHFKAKPDAAAIDYSRAHLIDVVKLELGASEVRSQKLTFAISGSVSKDGQTISFVGRATMTGRARVRGKWGSGTATDTLSFTGHPK